MSVFTRAFDELRPVTFELDYVIHPEGSVLISAGNTRVLCNATVQETLPAWLKYSNKRQGWVTAEYAMLPRSTTTRNSRESATTPKGRTQEIQRLIGRSLRGAVNLDRLGERQIIIDCDVIQADGGTRTASITGAFVALHDAMSFLKAQQAIANWPIRDFVAAVSVGIFQGTPVLDLDYPEDSNSDTDMNVVMTGGGRLVEVQGTAEGEPFSRRQLNEMLDLAERGIGQLVAAQKAALGNNI